MIRFLKCTAEQFLSLEKNENYFYYVDGERLYLGTKELTTRADVQDAIDLVNHESKGNEALYSVLTTLIGDGEGSIAEMIAQAKSEVVNSINGKNNGIIIEGSTTSKSIGIRLSSKPGNDLTIVNENNRKGLYINVPDYTVSIDTTPGENGDVYSKRYTVKQGAVGEQVTIANIDIPKDMVIEDGFVVDIVFDSSDDSLHEGSISGPDVTEKIKGSAVATAADAGKYIKLIIANNTNSTLYIFAKDLVDIYRAAENASQVQLSIDSSNIISAVIVANSIGTTELSNEVVSSLGKADSAVQTIVEGDSNGTIKVDDVEVKIHGLDTAAYSKVSDFDSAGSAEAVLGQSGDLYTQNTVYGAKAYTDEALTWKTVI